MKEGAAVVGTSYVDVDAACEGQLGQSNSNFSEFGIGHIGRRRAKSDFWLGNVSTWLCKKSVFHRRKTLSDFREKSRVGLSQSVQRFIEGHLMDITIYRRAVIDRPYRESDDNLLGRFNGVMLGMEI